MGDFSCVKVEHVIRIQSSRDQDDSLQYCLSQPIENRFAALEYLRQQWIALLSHAG